VDVGAAYLKVLSRHSPEKAEENDETISQKSV
jgi:hypothetical protein